MKEEKNRKGLAGNFLKCEKWVKSVLIALHG